MWLNNKKSWFGIEPTEVEIFEFINNIQTNKLHYEILKEYLIKKSLPLESNYLFYLLGSCHLLDAESIKNSIPVYKALLELEEWKNKKINFSEDFLKFKTEFLKSTSLELNDKLYFEMYISKSWKEISAIVKMNIEMRINSEFEQHFQ